jgi:uncharacterized protein with PIN domain
VTPRDEVIGRAASLRLAVVQAEALLERLLAEMVRGNGPRWIAERVTEVLRVLAVEPLRNPVTRCETCGTEIEFTGSTVPRWCKYHRNR